MMPDPLDVAFAALGNDHAGILLADELTTYEYAYDLHSMRQLADLHDTDYWNKNLYNMDGIFADLVSKSCRGPSGTSSRSPNKRLVQTYPKYTIGFFCDGPRSYVGLASSFHQVITENFKRLDDEEWSKEVQKGAAIDPEWMKDIAVK